ncbi:hypothetical protein BOX15_Mlig003841g5, partial [Macrostomum lignano]
SVSMESNSGTVYLVHSSNDSNDTATIRTLFNRWFLVLTLGLLNVSNAALWITYSAIADYTQLFYNVTADGVNWLALVYPLASLVFGLPTAYCLDRLGVRTGLLIGAIFSASGGAMRYASAILAQPSFSLALAGQITAAIAQPFFMFSPTAVASEFPVSQRATANTLGSMSNPLGILLTNILSPLLVKSKTDLPLVSLVYFIAAAAALLFSVVTSIFTRQAPAPGVAGSELHQSAAAQHLTFWLSIRACLTNRAFGLLLLAVGAGMGLFTALSALLEQILCPYGYSDQFAGICGAVLIGAGLVGAGVAGAVADYTKRFITLSKVSFSLAAATSAAFAALIGRPNSHAAVVSSIAAFGAFGFAFYPIALELGVEATHPVGEAVSTGLLVLAGQLASVVLMVAGQVLATPTATTALTACAVPPPMDYSLACLVFAGMAAVLAILYTLMFNTDYKRQEAEKRQLDAAKAAAVLLARLLLRSGMLRLALGRMSRLEDMLICQLFGAFYCGLVGLDFTVCLFFDH